MSDAIPRKMLEAARVSRFMEEDELGRWRLRHFTVTEEDFRRGTIKIAFSGDSEAERELQTTRQVPPGTYITLMRRMIWDEIRDLVFDNLDFYPEDAPEWFNLDRVLPEDNRYIPVMSDTPSEIREHRAAFKGAHGRVLVTGLGLGCLPHALLTNPKVTRIDIIEIDPEVIELTGRYLDDERVHVWNGSAADPSCLPADLRWDYAWHDIWTHISSRNLNPDTAEHRIAYSTVREVWESRVDGRQDCWAEEEALHMKAEHDRKVAEETEYRAYLRTLSIEERIEELYVHCLRSRIVNLGDDVQLTPEIIGVLDPEGGFRAHIEKMVGDPDFLDNYERDHDNTVTEAMGMPNAELEASRG